MNDVLAVMEAERVQCEKSGNWHGAQAIARAIEAVKAQCFS